MAKGYRLLIGSIGDDSHSVGMALLTLAFREAGFRVKNLGILNQLDDFFRAAKDFDAIFISCINGHVEMFLDDFPVKLANFNLGNGRPRVWYLGGNLSVKESNESVVRRYLKMGFDFVAPKPISWNAIMEQLLRDFSNKGIHPEELAEREEANISDIPLLETVTDDPLTEEEFAALRKEVLDSWHTGSQVWMADVKKNHSDKAKNLHELIVRRQSSKGAPLVQPRTGVSHTTDEIAILKHLRANGLEISSIQLDAASRKNMYHKAEEGVLRSEKGKTSFLNGYPIPVHGVRGVEEILQAIETPFQIRAGSPDHRLVYEIGLAGGTSSVEGGFICYLYPYDKHTSPVTCLRYWKYVDKLAALYDWKYNVKINREYFGPLTTSLIEPTIAIAINIVQAILSAKSGVKCISVGLAEQGNRYQDIAAIRALDMMTRRYLAKYGFGDCTVSTVYHQYMAAFPNDINKARDLIFNSSVTGTLAGSTRFLTKTPVESIHIPTKEDNAEGLRLTHAGIKAAQDSSFDREQVLQEMKMLEKQVAGVMESIELLGQGSVARGALRAFLQGILDIPFSPSIYNRNRLITARDSDGAIRFVNPEAMPFDTATKEFHLAKIHQRMVRERMTRPSQIIEKDLTRIWKNDYFRWPLDGTYLN